MINQSKTFISVALMSAWAGMLVNHEVVAQELAAAVTSGSTKINLNLRYEQVEQDNNLQDASALTLRTLLSYTTGKYQNFSAMIELEDTRIVMGQGDYTVGPTGYNTGIYSVIADPEHTELDQAYVQYATDTMTAKFGRQVITMDNHRFVGHVGWRQDRQTFDGVSFSYNASKDLSLNYAYLTQRNRIFAEMADLDAKDHLLNVSYQTSVGKFTAYSYMLEVDNTVENSLDTYGVRFNGNTKLSDIKVIYAAEFATQSSETAVTDFEADYLLLEAGAVFADLTAKLSFEALGSDNGAYGFSTPLATLHKFNGWADTFLNTPIEGLVDTSISLSGKAGPGSWVVVYHDFEADSASDLVDDLGSEVDLQYVGKFAQNYSYGLKYAAYSGKSGRTDTDKLWIWVGAKF